MPPGGTLEYSRSRGRGREQGQGAGAEGIKSVKYKVHCVYGRKKL